MASEFTYWQPVSAETTAPQMQEDPQGMWVSREDAVPRALAVQLKEALDVIAELGRELMPVDTRWFDAKDKADAALEAARKAGL